MSKAINSIPHQSGKSGLTRRQAVTALAVVSAAPLGVAVAMAGVERDAEIVALGNELIAALKVQTELGDVWHAHRDRVEAHLADYATARGWLADRTKWSMEQFEERGAEFERAETAVGGEPYRTSWDAWNAASVRVEKITERLRAMPAQGLAGIAAKCVMVCCAMSMEDQWTKSTGELDYAAQCSRDLVVELAALAGFVLPPAGTDDEGAA